jgi:hypothetical protein
MTPLPLVLILAAAGTLQFDAVDIPGLQVYYAGNLTGDRVANFRTIRINADTQPDLFFADRVLFATENGFTETPLSHPPYADWDAEIDVHDRNVYVRTRDGVSIFRLEGSAWTRVAQHAIAWPNPDPQADLMPERRPIEGTGTVLRRFLYIPDSGVPMIALPYFDGLHLYHITADGYREWPALDIFPEPTYVPDTLGRDPDAPLPPAAWRFRMLIEADRVTVWSPRYLWDNRVRYVVDAFRIEQTGDQIRARSLNAMPLPDLPAHFEPVRLNNDATFDFAGGQTGKIPAGIFPIPTYTTQVITAAGPGIQQFQARGWRPNAALVDVDGDGRTDIVVETAGLLRSGPRETINRWLTMLNLPHRVAVHLQTESATFPNKPSFTTDMDIRLPSPPVRNDEFFHRYRWGELVSLLGDYNGDGMADLAVQSRPNRIEIRLNTGNGFERDPLVIEVPRMSLFTPYDVNGNGRSDLVITAPSNDADAPPRTIVYFSRRTGG